MNKEVETLALSRSRYPGLSEMGIMALLLAVSVIQIACALTASKGMMQEQPRPAVITHL